MSSAEEYKIGDKVIAVHPSLGTVHSFIEEIVDTGAVGTVTSVDPDGGIWVRWDVGMWCRWRVSHTSPMHLDMFVLCRPTCLMEQAHDLG